ncbi:MAG: tRNA pseudouridine(55) synthase TruB [Negativicutes bacterium]|nr:tRNA pseudouridine(55) synthase TruB [Negativicutes bacterium]
MERSQVTDMHGVINLAKPAGPTSHDLVAFLRRQLKVKQIGHTGTLDPLATGVLPLCVGDATRLAEYLTGRSKTYRVSLLLGWRSDSYDLSGCLTESAAFSLAANEVLQVLSHFRGELQQIPPMHSAISVNGTRLYELARKGESIEREARPILIEELRLLTELPAALQKGSCLALEVTCSKGTYIRTLCEDIGNQLGCGAVMQQLQRTRSGLFCLEQAFSKEEVEEACAANQAAKLFSKLTPAHLGLPACILSDTMLRELHFGRTVWLPAAAVEAKEILVCDAEGNLHAIAEIGLDTCRQNLVLKPHKVFVNLIAMDLPAIKAQIKQVTVCR